MFANRELIENNYTDPTREDGRATQSRSSSIEFHYTKKIMAEFISKDSRVLELGCATGYYAMAFADSCKEYVGVDLMPHHIEMLERKIADKGFTNITAMVGDATNLTHIPDSSFDVLCCFGPMYHLPPEGRELVFAECSRICKPGGIAAFAYINKVGVYVGACVGDNSRAIYPNTKTTDHVFRLGMDDERPGLFFFTMPEEMEASAKKYGFTKVKNVGTDFFITMNVIDQMDDEKFTEYLKLADKMVEYESCTGMSNHALLICKNKEAQVYEHTEQPSYPL